MIVFGAQATGGADGGCYHLISLKTSTLLLLIMVQATGGPDGAAAELRAHLGLAWAVGVLYSHFKIYCFDIWHFKQFKWRLVPTS